MKTTQAELQEMWLHNQNFFTGHYYLSLKNQQALKAAWFNTPFWLTFNQAKKNWIQIKKWSKSVEVRYYQYKDEETDEKLETPKVYSWKLFNLEQTEPKSEEWGEQATDELTHANYQQHKKKVVESMEMPF